MDETQICDEDFLVFALQHYENPQCISLEEFYEDLDRIKYLKRLMNRLDGDNEQRNRLVLNHIIILTNVFGARNANRILFFRMEQKYHKYLKTYLHFLNMLVAEIPEANLAVVEIDNKLFEELRKI
jgi:hypothetical protein